MRFLQSIFLSSFRAPVGWGDPEQRGPLSSQASFSEGPEADCLANLQKAKPAIWEGNRNPQGLELPSAGAERGNYPEAKPSREGLKGDLRATTRNLETDERRAGASIRRRYQGSFHRPREVES
jgi:hypothetical protein